MKLSSKGYFSLILFGILGGIFLGNLLDDIFLTSIIVFQGSLLGIYFLKDVRHFYISYASVILGVIIGMISCFYFAAGVSQKQFIVDRYDRIYNSYIGEVKQLHKKSDYYDEYIIHTRHIDDREISLKIDHILRIPKNFLLHPGQQISYSGKLYDIKDFDGFSYKKYMQSRNIYFAVLSVSVDILESNVDTFNYHLFHSRQNLLGKIERIFPKEEAIFLGGILLGARENIPPDLKEDFNNSGLTHFIAVSGFNITLCILFMTFFFGFLPSSIRIVCIPLSIVLFCLFVGPSAPVVRAAIMGILAYIFLQSGNKTDSMVLVLFTAVCMTLFSPLSLNYDISLHLSFLAVIGIIYTQDILLKVFSFLPQTFAIREAFVLTLSALSFTLPIMIFNFGQLSLMSPIANIAMAWSIPIAMLLGACTLLVSIFSELMSIYVGFIAWIFLAYDIGIVRFFGNMDWALLHFDFGVYKPYLQTLYFIIMTYILTLYHIRKKKQF